MSGESLDRRKAEVRRRLSLSAVVERHVKLSGTAASARRRGKCPFHGGNSPSFALFDAADGEGRGHCFGCQWHGDLFEFQRDIRGISFMDALAELEGMAGLASSSGAVGRQESAPIKRERNPSPARSGGREPAAPIEMARALWRRARPDEAAVRRYFEGRAVPRRALTDDRIGEFRYLAECPCTLWPEGENWALPGDPIAPAIMAMVKRPVARETEDGAAWVDWIPVGLHVTWLNPAGDGTMRRRKPWARKDDPDPWLPRRKMLGPVGGGAVLLGTYRPDAPLWVGEGNETVLSAMGLAEAAAEAVGVATLSLDNLQGAPLLWKNRVWPLFAMRPDPERPCFTIPGHRGPVIGLIDSDMSPLRGKRERGSGDFLGEAVVERRGGGIVRRPITGAERARICGELFVRGWRDAGVHDVAAVRAPAGKDFNDVAAERAREAVGA